MLFMALLFLLVATTGCTKVKVDWKSIDGPQAPITHMILYYSGFEPVEYHCRGKSKFTIIVEHPEDVIRVGLRTSGHDEMMVYLSKDMQTDLVGGWLGILYAYMSDSDESNSESCMQQ